MAQVHRRWMETAVAQWETDALQFVPSDPLRRNTLFVPEVFSEEYPPGPPRLGWTRILDEGHDTPPPTSVLWRFLELARASDEEIIAFAQEWGPLGICMHGLPYFHDAGCYPLSWEDQVWLPDEERKCPPEAAAWAACWEPLEAWRFYARQFSAILVLAIAGREGRLADAELVMRTFPVWSEMRGPDSVQWGSAFQPYTPGEINVFQSVASSKAEVSPQRHVSTALTRLLRDVKPNPVVYWSDAASTSQIVLRPGKPQIDQPPLSDGRIPGWNRWFDNLFGHLVVQLAAVTGQAQETMLCTRCGEPTPKSRNKQFCASCAEARRQERQRNFTRKKRATKQT